MKFRLSVLFSHLLFLFTHKAHAASDAAPSIGAPALVGGITGMGTAMAQSPKPHKALTNRLEVIAGADSLVALSDVLKQASLFAEARYRLSEMTQLGVSAGVRLQGDGLIREMAGQFLFGPTFNFGADNEIQNAFFVSPKVGVTLVRKSVGEEVVQSGVNPTLAVNVGKRFAFNSNIAYTPSLGVVKQLGYAPCFVAVPIAISVFF